MRALRGAKLCFSHDPSTASARADARKRAAAATNGKRAAATAKSATEATAPAATFALGDLASRHDIAPTLLRLAHAIARGEVSPRRARLLVQSLKAATDAFEASGERARP